MCRALGAPASYTRACAADCRTRCAAGLSLVNLALSVPLPLPCSCAGPRSGPAAPEPHRGAAAGLSLVNLALFAWVASGYRYKAVPHKRRAPKKVKQALPPRVGRAGSGGPAGPPQWARPQPMRIPAGPVRPCRRP